MRGLAAEGAMGSSKIVEAFPSTVRLLTKIKLIYDACRIYLLPLANIELNAVRGCRVLERSGSEAKRR